MLLWRRKNRCNPLSVWNMAYKVKASLHTCLADSHVQTARPVFVKRAGRAYLLAHKADAGQSNAAARGEGIKVGCNCESNAHIKATVIWILLPCFFLTVLPRFLTDFPMCLFLSYCTYKLRWGGPTAAVPSDRCHPSLRMFCSTFVFSPSFLTI